MTDPAASARFWAVGLFVAWLAAFAGGYIGYALTEPTDFGFTRGLNRVYPWLWGQIFAFIFAVTAWFSVRGRRAHLTRAMILLGRLPLFIMFVEAVIFFGLIAFAMLMGSNVEPYAPAGPPTSVAPDP
jgi:hypothetical protein